MPNAPFLVAGLVLMGGRATRMGGGDKALVEIAGRPVLARLLERFRPQVGPLALSANGDPARLEAYGCPVLMDPSDAPEGPLAGVLAGLAWADGLPGVTHLATVPGDAPAPPPDLVERLLSANCGGVAAAHGPRGIEPLHALWPLSSKRLLDVLAAKGVRSPKLALERLEAAPARFNGPSDFLDIDAPEDVPVAERLLGGD